MLQQGRERLCLSVAALAKTSWWLSLWWWVVVVARPALVSAVGGVQRWGCGLGAVHSKRPLAAVEAARGLGWCLSYLGQASQVRVPVGA